MCRSTAGRRRHDQRPRRESCSKRIGVRRTRFIFARAKRACIYCRATDGPLHLDHVVPRCHGGRDEVCNLVVACAACNSARQGKTLRQWYAYLRTEKGWTAEQTTRVARRVRRHLAKPYTPRRPS